MADPYWELSALARSCANAVGRIIFFSFVMILDEDALVDNCLNRQGHWGTEHYRKVLLWDQDLKSGSLAQEVLFRNCQGWSIWESDGEFTSYPGPGLVKWEGPGMMKCSRCLANLEVKKASTTNTLYQTTEKETEAHKDYGLGWGTLTRKRIGSHGFNVETFHCSRLREIGNK